MHEANFEPPHTTKSLRIAVVGSGISGLAAAHVLGRSHQVTLYEALDYFGGHTHTVDVTLPGAEGLVTHGVDTGFLVFNERTYPQLIALFEQLSVPTASSDMSFSVKAQTASGRHLEWSGSNLRSVFTQARNALSPAFWRMLVDIVRFNRLVRKLALSNQDEKLKQPLGEFLQTHRFSRSFCDWYFLPMMACIWSCPTQQMLAFPVATMVRFCFNHGLIELTQRPQWFTVAGGARQYVEKIIAGIEDKRLNTPVQSITRLPDGQVEVRSQGRSEIFDRVVLATHSDQALRLLSDASASEQQVLGAIKYQPNKAVLHLDASVLPRSQGAWAAWNYERAPASKGRGAGVCLHYLLNRLQPLPFAQPVIVSLNPVHPIAPSLVLDQFDYSHPVLDLAAIEAQKSLAQLQGVRNTYFCGAWTGYGFHEDGLKSGLQVASLIAS